jgi:hypothetical protein
MEVLTPSDKKFIRRKYLQLSSREIGATLGHPRGTIMSFLKREGLRVPRKIALEFKERARMQVNNAKVHPEDELIKELYLLLPKKNIADLLGRSDTFIEGRMKKLKLTVPISIKQFFVEYARIKPGNIPLNKGKKQIEYMSKEAIQRTKATRFQKGQLPSNTKERNGVITVRYDHKNRGGKAYKYIRISLGKWMPYHQYRWEKKNGKLPKGMCLWFKDSDPMNCKLSNLELITRGENMRRNSSSLRLTDGYVAVTLLGGNKKSMDEELYNELKQNKPLLEAKRQQLLLNRSIKEHEKRRQHSK